MTIEVLTFFSFWLRNKLGLKKLLFTLIFGLTISYDIFVMAFLFFAV